MGNNSPRSTSRGPFDIAEDLQKIFSVRQFSDSPSFPKSERNNSQRKLRGAESILHSIITALCAVLREVSEERSIADLQGLEVVVIRLPHTQP